MTKKITSFFSPDFESVFAKHLTGKIILSLDFNLNGIYLILSFGFHGLPLLMFKTDQLDLRGLDPGKSDIILLTSLKCSLFYIQKV